MADSAFPNDTSRTARVERPHRPALARAAAHRSDTSTASASGASTLRTSNHASSRRPAPVSAPKRVRVPELALGIVLVAGSALGAVVWHQSTSASAQALVLAVPVERGHTFSTEDFKPATVRTDGVLLVDFARAEEFAGRIATANLSVGAPVTPDVAAAVLPLADGQALVGRRLEAGEFPGGLTVGASVEIVLIVDPDAQAALTETDIDAVDEQTQLSATPAADAEESSLDNGTASAENPPGPEPGTEVESDADGRIIAIVEALEESPDGLLATIATLRVDQSAAASVASAEGVRLVQVPAS